MIQICPAILTDNINEFERQLLEYTKLFDLIDIDINDPGDSFSGLNTVSSKEVAKRIKEYQDIRFNIHLMVQNPSNDINMFTGIDNAVFLVHQEANINQLIGKPHVNLAIQAHSKPREIDFYNNFEEIQLMTVDIGYQGSEFKSRVLNRVEWLRSEGYKGRISIDGAVNLQTAEQIKKFDINRVSVGSYLSKSTNLEFDKQKLELALNM